MITTANEAAQQKSLISAAATLQHIGNLNDRATKLMALRIEAEEQLLHRLAGAWLAGDLGAAELVEIHRRYKQLGFPGRMTRWNEAMPVPWNRVRYLTRWIPNGPEGTWLGPWPTGADDPVPPPKAFVVYVLFAASNEPIYVGSTGNFHTRLHRHAVEGKPFVHWQAYPAADREAAYRLEDRVLREQLPALNKRAGR